MNIKSIIQMSFSDTLQTEQVWTLELKGTVHSQLSSDPHADGKLSYILKGVWSFTAKQ